MKDVFSGMPRTQGFIDVEREDCWFPLCILSVEGIVMCAATVCNRSVSSDQGKIKSKNYFNIKVDNP